MNSPYVNNSASCPTVKEYYQRLTDEEKKKKISEEMRLSNLDQVFRVSSLGKDGYVFVELLQEYGADRRGTALLDLELILKKNIDQGITVWCEPLGDKNSLRKLRGITIRNNTEDQL